MERKPQKICLVSFFVHEAFFIPLSQLREIILKISPESNSIITVSPELADKMIFDFKKDVVIIHKNKRHFVFRIINYFILNLKISWSILIKSKDVDSYLFFNETGLLLPMIIAKLRNKQTIWVLPSSYTKMIEHHRDFLNSISIYLQSLSFHIVDKIVLYSPRLISEWNLEKYRNKILISHNHYINNEKFKVTTCFSDRPFLIGYIGRLSAEKGVQNFVRALPAILNDTKGLRVLIGGDGHLKNSIQSVLQEEKLTDYVDLPGWVSNENYPKYLNQLRLLVLSSYTEGLPYTILEAMTCGTPVLATPVGAIPDIIIDGKTGFIMEDNLPECIAENVSRALRSPNLDKIAENGRRFVEENFTFEKTTENWNRILNKLE
jgi:glycosyltransferase involved in cell wall biosynthesis